MVALLRRVSLTFGGVWFSVAWFCSQGISYSLSRQKQGQITRGLFVTCVSAGLALTDTPALTERIRKPTAKPARTKSISQSAKCSSSFPWILCSSPVAIRLEQQGSSCTHSTNICQCYFSSGMERKSLWSFILVRFWDENGFAILDKVN